MTLNNIDINTREGKLLMAALAIMTTSPQLRIDGKNVNGREITPDEMLSHIANTGTWLYGDFYVDN